MSKPGDGHGMVMLGIGHGKTPLQPYNSPQKKTKRQKSSLNLEKGTLDQPIHQCSYIHIIAPTTTVLFAAAARFCPMDGTFDIEGLYLGCSVGR